MRIIILSIIISLCVTNLPRAEETQQFVNPLFNQVMQPVSTTAWRTKITPTQMVSDKKGTVLIQKCTLIENTWQAVTLQCEGAYDKESILQYRFIPQPEKKAYTGLSVVMYFKSPDDKDYGSSDRFVVETQDIPEEYKKFLTN